jgi:glyoxylase I family protein
MAFTVASRKELEHWATELTLAGVEHSGIVEIPPGAILNFKDPNGIALALFGIGTDAPVSPKRWTGADEP